MTVGFIPNLHIICPDPDGAVYIPTGKSLVRQLMATGLHTATKRLQLGKETLLQASIVGDQRFIKITADVCRLFMDSGMVDLGNIGYLHPDFLGADGKLIYGSSQQGEKIYLGYLSSNLTNTRKLPLNGEAARSYKAAIYPDGHPQEGQRMADSEQSLALKKICSVWVSPSTFTGKMRLYVQAQYGSLLDNFKFRPNAANAPPSLDYDHDATGLTYQFHPNSTGIYLDSNMNHWLVQIGVNAAYVDNSDTVNITPMKASTCGESLRKQLRKLTPGTKQFDQIEAYILSTSYPVPFNRRWPNSAIVKPCVGAANRGSMGYGWKFNWSGNKADIISITAEWNELDTIAKFKSHHLRISISRAPSELVPYKQNPDMTAEENALKEWEEEAARWTVSFGEVEVSAWWHNGKWVNVIAYPDFTQGNLAIFGTVLGGSYADNVPIYCFYTRDDDNTPKIVRHTAADGAAVVEYMRESTPSYCGGNIPWNTSGAGGCATNTLGMEGGSTEQRTRVNQPRVTSFSAGAASISTSDQSYSGIRQTVSGKHIVSESFYSATTWVGSSGWDVWQGDPLDVVLSGTGCVLSSGLWPTIHVGEGWYAGSAGIYVEATGADTSVTHSEGSITLCVIPFGDAEAVYLWGKEWETTSNVGTSGVGTTSTWVSGGCQYSDESGGSGAENIINKWYYNKFGDFMPGGTVAVNDYTETYTFLGAKCISNAGVHDFDPTNYVASAFFAGEPNSSVGQQFHTVTSAVDATMWGAGVNKPNGYPKSGHAFIGWA